MVFCLLRFRSSRRCCGWSEAAEQIRFNDDVAGAGEFVCHLTCPVAHAEYLVNHHDDRSLVLDFGVDDPGVELASTGLVDGDVFAVSRALGKVGFRPILRRCNRREKRSGCDCRRDDVDSSHASESTTLMSPSPSLNYKKSRRGRHKTAPGLLLSFATAACPRSSSPGRPRSESCTTVPGSP